MFDICCRRTEAEGHCSHFGLDWPLLGMFTAAALAGALAGRAPVAAGAYRGPSALGTAGAAAL